MVVCVDVTTTLPSPIIILIVDDGTNAVAVVLLLPTDVVDAVKPEVDIGVEIKIGGITTDDVAVDVDITVGAVEVVVEVGFDTGAGGTYPFGINCVAMIVHAGSLLYVTDPLQPEPSVIVYPFTAFSLTL